MRFYAIPFFALALAVPQCTALADEPYAGYEMSRRSGGEDGGQRINLYQKAAERPGWWSDCGRRITARECVRIQMKNRDRERAERRGPRAPSGYRDYDGYREDRARADYERPIQGQCARETYTMEGAKNLAPIIARMNAREAWRRKVRALHGTRYEDVNFAVNKTQPQKCWNEGMFTRCEFRARPCKA